MPATILIVDDDPVQRRLVEACLVRCGHQTLSADSGEGALAILDSGREVAAVVLDLVMPGMDGFEVLRRLRARGVFIPVIVQTAQGGVDAAVAAMRGGAFDFVVKPAAPERLRTALANALKVEALEGRARRSGRRGAVLGFNDLICRSAAMDKVVRLARKAAASNIPILIEGESGVGKEIVARAIQGSGERRSRPFVTVNCGAIPDNLVESILFGHEKGAFTGAQDKHAGKFVEAHGGTLFLDEIGDLPLDVQVKLLRAVQDGEVDPVGARAPLKVDIRLISATHRDLIQRVREGKFREDLFYRLNVFPIFIPPLRERKEDIPLLVDHFLARVGAAGPSGKITGVAREALAMLMAYDWPGNIRQLENAVFRAAVLAEGSVLTPEEFPQIRAETDGIDLGPIEDAPETPEDSAAPVDGTALAGRAVATDNEGPRRGASSSAPIFGLMRALDDSGNVRELAAVELEMIQFAIELYRGQMSEVARRLGIGRSTLYRKLKEYGIDPEEERGEKAVEQVS